MQQGVRSEGLRNAPRMANNAEQAANLKMQWMSEVNFQDEFRVETKNSLINRLQMLVH